MLPCKCRCPIAGQLRPLGEGAAVCEERIIINLVIAPE